ncbi:four helix bundle protein [Lutimonas halocynthiae]|uniref:four helix bundle protein n=1 Tax=Lutimonas halocynthiae TaxID=1446477 RepID=UPI0025B610FD|nr:four helix bundle protein [Lutimonas halocynthiae]MDN3641653.1 four helix bundle protein [Lutimonas halocynthiae]
MNRNDLETRLIEFSVVIIKLSRKMRKSYAARNLSSQLIRSGTSVSLNYGEAQSGESRKDFIHKLKIILKELRESYICLRIIQKTQLCSDVKELEIIKTENNELISIFVKSITTASKN